MPTSPPPDTGPPPPVHVHGTPARSARDRRRIQPAHRRLRSAGRTAIHTRGAFGRPVEDPPSRHVDPPGGRRSRRLGAEGDPPSRTDAVWRRRASLRLQEASAVTGGSSPGRRSCSDRAHSLAGCPMTSLPCGPARSPPRPTGLPNSPRTTASPATRHPGGPTPPGCSAACTSAGGPPSVHPTTTGSGTSTPVRDGSGCAGRSWPPESVIPSCRRASTPAFAASLPQKRRAFGPAPSSGPPRAPLTGRHGTS